MPSQTDALDDTPSKADVKKYQALLWPGCNQAVYHNNPHVNAMVQLSRNAYETAVPQFGSFWGLQMATFVAGGAVELHPKGREMRLGRNTYLTPSGQTHPMMQGKPQVYTQLSSHDDQVTQLPPDSILLAGNDWSNVQAAEIKYKEGVFWAVQYHSEYDLHELARLIVAREERLVKQGLFRDYNDLMQYVKKLEELYQNPDRKDLQWQLGVGQDILDDTIRECEFANFIKYIC